MANRGRETTPSKKAVFECICREYDCSVSFAVISKRQDLFPRGCGNISSWFEAQKDSFLLSEDQNGAITTVSAFCRRARLCFGYTSYKKCSKENCQYLHVCKSFVAGYCRFGERCNMNHDFRDEKDQKLLSKLKLNGLTDEELFTVVQNSLPRVCQEYNEGHCLKGENCSLIHICKNFIKKKCHDEDNCSLEHEAALWSTRARTVLGKYGINPNGPTNTVLRMLVVCDDQPTGSKRIKQKAAAKNVNLQSTNAGSSESATNNRGHVHTAKPNTAICSDFLLGKCKKGKSCSGHHCSRPFHWQYKLLGPEEWKSFSEKDNDTVEKLFCDPTQEKCGVDGLQMNRNPTWNHHGQAVINLVDDKIVLGDGSVGVLRRLSTESFVKSPSNPLATKWTWYWKDEYECWREYDEDRYHGDLQFLIEEAFLNRPTTAYQFATSAHDYQVYFATMFQQNMTQGTVRQIKRRPLMLISDEDIQQLKSQHGSSATKKPQGKSSNLPSHWSAMSRDEQFKRAKLAASSQEYKTVETLFRNTMKERVTNISIERVQNPFMWEKYCRKKENMATVKTRGREKKSANEKRLFHGTSPEAVVAICKQNFDWRLHGKNATVYGEGSYFAVNASYSHSYAKRDVDSCQYMFLANVLVGSYTKGHGGLRRPPAINPSNPESDLYDSCVDDKYDPTIFVVFDTDQFYPAYIIKYSAVSQNAPVAARNYGVQQPAQTSRPYNAVQSYTAVRHNYGVQQPAQTSQSYTAVQSYSIGASNYSATPGYSSGSGGYSSTSVQSSHATRTSTPRLVKQVSSPQYQTSRGSSSSAPRSFSSAPSHQPFSSAQGFRGSSSSTRTSSSKKNCSVM